MAGPEALDANPTPEEAAAELGQKFQDALSQQRSVWEHVATYAKDETTRFAKLRLDRTAATVQSVDMTKGYRGLMEAQQQWLRDMINDYASQSMRYTQLLRNVAIETADAASETGKKTLAEGEDLIDESASAVEKTSDAIEDSINVAVEHGEEAASQFADNGEQSAEQNP